MKYSLLSLALASLAPLASAQSEVTVPEGFANTYTGNTTFLFRSTLFHFQCVYDARHLFNQNINHPIEISRLRFRPLNGTVHPGGVTYPQVTVKLSTSNFDSATMNTSFAANEGLDVVTVYSGPVTTLPTLGGTPNDAHIDIVLTTPFIYNPENGPLLVDVDAPQAASGTMPNQAASSNYTTQFARRVSTATAGATTGALSAFAAAMKIDYTIPAGTAFAFEYGLGCYHRYVSFYEEFAAGTIDLGSSGQGVTTGQQMIPNGNGGYVVVPNAGSFVTPTSPDLALGDDVVTAAMPLGFTFPHPGGNCTDIQIDSNGKLFLEPTTSTGSIVSHGPVALTTLGSQICGLYDDFDPSLATGGGSVHFETDAVNGVAYITWMNVPHYAATLPTPRPTSTFQIALYSTGIYETRYQLIDTVPSWTLATVGYSPGHNNKVPPMSDISAGGINTAPDLNGLHLSTNQRPVIGGSLTLTTSDIPATSPFTFMFVSLFKNTAGSDLAALGMPGCSLYAGDMLNMPMMTGLALGAPSNTFAFGLPTSSVFSGVSIALQSASYVPGVNALEFLSSNGLDLSLGTL